MILILQWQVDAREEDSSRDHRILWLCSSESPTLELWSLRSCVEISVNACTSQSHKTSCLTDLGSWLP